ncbi:MAG: hypothetical protein JXR82_01020 [Marinifilaceae bacterium]|nr:hypothetical protein [Marinifilaceae bacterium]
MYKLNFLIAVVLMFLNCSVSFSQTDCGIKELPNVTIDEIPQTVLRICGNDYESIDLKKWKPNLIASLERLRKNCYGTESAFSIKSITKNNCPELENNSLYGKEGIVMCEEIVLERIAYASAMLSGFQILSVVKRLNSPTGVTDNIWKDIIKNIDNKSIGTIEVLSLIDAVEADANIFGNYAPGEKTKLEKVKLHLINAFGANASEQIDAAITAAWGIQELDLNPQLTNSMPLNEALIFDVMLAIYRTTLDETLSFVIGHEMAHAHKGSPIKTNLPQTNQNRLIQFINIQICKNFFCKNPPSISEINADRCALRTLYMTDNYFQRQENLISMEYRIKKGFINIGRRNTIDLLSFFFAAKISMNTQESFTPYFPSPALDGRPQYFPELKKQKGYIYPALRLLLVADLLAQQSSPKECCVGIYGTSAERLMEMIVRARSGCKEVSATSMRNLTSEFYKLDLPVTPAVAEFFSSHTYTFESLKCKD